MNALAMLIEAIRQVIKSSKLSRSDQDDIGRQLATIPVIVNDIASQGRGYGKKGRNGDDADEESGAAETETSAGTASESGRRRADVKVNEKA